MNEQSYIYPILIANETSNNINKTDIYFDEITNETVDVLYENVYYKNIGGDLINDKIKKITKHMIENKHKVNFDILNKILQLYLLTDNFYLWLKNLIEKQEVEIQHNISIQQLKLQKHDQSIAKNEGFLSFLYDLLLKNDTRNDTKDLICCYMLVNSFKFDKEKILTVKNVDKFVFVIYHMVNNDLDVLSRTLSDYRNTSTNAEKFFIAHIDYVIYIYTVTTFYHGQEYVNFIKNCNSHVLIDLLYENIKNFKDYDRILIDTYNERNVQATVSIFTKMFNENELCAEILLKKLIMETQTKMLYNLFYSFCKSIDHDYIEACLVNADHIDKMGDNQTLEITNSSFFTLLTRKLAVYKKCMHKISKSSVKLSDIIRLGLINFRQKSKVSLIELQKFLFFIQIFPGSKNAMFDYLQSIFDSMENSYTITNSNKTTKKNSKDSTKTSEEYKNTICDIVNEYRKDIKIQKYIKILVESLGMTFIYKCVFIDTKKTDTFAIATINCITENQMKIEYTDSFWVDFKNYLAKSCSNNDYWNVTVRKQLDCVNIKNFEIYHSKINEKNRNKKLDDIFDIKYVDDHETLLQKLSLELQKNILDYEIIAEIIKTSNHLSFYQNGLVFYDSCVEIYDITKIFCFYAVYFQHHIDGLQTLVSFTNNDNYECSLCLENSKMLLCIKIDDYVEKTSLFENQPVTKSISLGFKCKNNILKLYVYDTKHSIKIRDCEKISIGNNFKGTIQKLLWHEGYDYDAKFFTKQPKAEFYQNVIAKLERKMAFKHEKGVFLCHILPYFLIKKVNIKITNVLYNENVYWIENKNVTSKMFELAQKDDKMLDTLNQYCTDFIHNTHLSNHND